MLKSAKDFLLPIFSCFYFYLLFIFCIFTKNMLKYVIRRRKETAQKRKPEKI
jgi:hypothetical protein